MRKTLALVLLVALLMTAFTGCQAAAPEEQIQEDDSQDSVQSVEDDFPDTSGRPRVRETTGTE